MYSVAHSSLLFALKRYRTFAPADPSRRPNRQRNLRPSQRRNLRPSQRRNRQTNLQKSRPPNQFPTPRLLASPRGLRFEVPRKRRRESPRRLRRESPRTLPPSHFATLAPGHRIRNADTRNATQWRKLASNTFTIRSKRVIAPAEFPPMPRRTRATLEASALSRERVNSSTKKPAPLVSSQNPKNASSRKVASHPRFVGSTAKEAQPACQNKVLRSVESRASPW